MFDTPNGERFLGSLSSLAKRFSKFVDILETQLLERGVSWTKRDQLAWELFRLRYGISPGAIRGEKCQRNIADCYEDVDTFLKWRK